LFIFIFFFDNLILFAIRDFLSFKSYPYLTTLPLTYGITPLEPLDYQSVNKG